MAVLDGHRVVSANFDNTLKVWSLTSGECLQTLTGHSDLVPAMAVLEGDRIVSASLDGALKVWSATDPRRHMAVLQINRHWQP